MQIQLTWIDPNTGDRREPLLETPVTIGRQFAIMPGQIAENRVSRIVIEDDLMADYHALITTENQELIIIDQDTSNGIKINGVQSARGILQNSDRIQIGSTEIVIQITSVWECDRMVGFLFKRRCGRTDTINCPHCNQTYTEDYAYYPEYGSYRYGWGSNHNRDEFNEASKEENSDDPDFTEADGISLEEERNTDFETNMGAS